MPEWFLLWQVEQRWERRLQKTLSARLSLTTIIILLVAITTSVILCHYYFINMFNMFILFLDHPSHVSRKTIIIMSCQERSHPQHNCHPSGGVFQLCPQGMINLVWFSRPGNCVFLFFFLVLLNDPSKSFHHPCFYYNLWKGNGLGFIHLGYLYPFLKKLNPDIFTQFLLFCIVEHPSNTCIKINAQQKIPSEREVQQPLETAYTVYSAYIAFTAHSVYTVSTELGQKGYLALIPHRLEYLQCKKAKNW